MKSLIILLCFSIYPKLAFAINWGTYYKGQFNKNSIHDDRIEIYILNALDPATNTKVIYYVLVRNLLYKYIGHQRILDPEKKFSIYSDSSEIPNTRYQEGTAFKLNFRSSDEYIDPEILEYFKSIAKEDRNETFQPDELVLYIPPGHSLENPGSFFDFKWKFSWKSQVLEIPIDSFNTKKSSVNFSHKLNGRVKIANKFISKCMSVLRGY